MYFPREALAKELVAQLSGKAVFGDAHNGLFLAAPRRTGKSTFLQSDLVPALQREGVVVAYVDLWADRRRDPGDLISAAVARALAARTGLLGKTLQNAGLESVTIPGLLKIDLSKIGKIDGVTLPDALREFYATAKAPVALIIDEAQHSLTSDAGEAAMASLTSARDQLNRPGEVNLMLVMSGSDRDKLLRLVNTSGAPFYGSQVSRMPLLGQDFIDHIARLVIMQRPELASVDAALLFEAFERFGRRPQFFMEALGQSLSPLLDLQGGSFEQAVLDAASARLHAEHAQMESEYLALGPLQRAVLWRLLEQGPRFRPYDGEALGFYRRQVSGRVTAQMAQSSLESLRERIPAVVWKSARGEYSVDDTAMHLWYEQRMQQGSWPPAEPVEPQAFETHDAGE